MRIPDFEFLNPGDQTLALIYYSTGSNYVVKQANFNVTDCNNNNLFEVLQNVNSFVFTIDGIAYGADVISREQKVNYWHFEITDFFIPPSAPGVVDSFKCYSTTVTPGPDVVGFANGEYDVLVSNATDTRTSGYIYEVDRSTEYVVPGNYNNIISESAQKAEIADSNYSSVGILNSRYDGAETTISDYGVEPLISGKLFEAEVYLTTASNAYICSQSYENRNIEELLFSITASSAQDSELPVKDSKIFELDKSRILPIKDRKLWLADNNTIITTDANGIVQATITTCSIE